MKTLELEQFGVLEMNAKEMKETDGGIGFWVGLFLGGLIYDIISSPSDCADGFSDGFNSF